MYKIPESLNINEIQGDIIFQIAFGLNFITFFINKGYIQVSGGFSLTIGNQKYEYEEVYPVKNDFGLLQILEKKIINVEINSLRDVVTLFLEEEIMLQFIGDPAFESYTININGVDLIV